MSNRDYELQKQREMQSRQNLNALIENPNNTNYRPRYKSKGKKKKPKEGMKFMAMSKLLGYFSLGLVAMVTVYALFEMHKSQNYESLTTLIVAAFGLLSIYISFYIIMAKAEHIEDIRSELQRDLQKAMKEKDEEKAQFLKEQIGEATSASLDVIKTQVDNLIR